MVAVCGGLWLCGWADWACGCSELVDELVEVVGVAAFYENCAVVEVVEVVECDEWQVVCVARGEVVADEQDGFQVGVEVLLDEVDDGLMLLE